MQLPGAAHHAFITDDDRVARENFLAVQFKAHACSLLRFAA
jgi:hypothetical protein